MNNVSVRNRNTAVTFVMNDADGHTFRNVANNQIEHIIELNV